MLYIYHVLHILLQMKGKESIHRVPLLKTDSPYQPMGNVFSPHTIFRLKMNNSHLEDCDELKCKVTYSFHSYLEDQCTAVAICSKVLSNEFMNVLLFKHKKCTGRS